jgi:hypothetical protein
VLLVVNCGYFQLGTFVSFLKTRVLRGRLRRLVKILIGKEHSTINGRMLLAITRVLTSFKVAL